MSKTILVVEDHNDFRQAVVGILQSHGYLVRQATNGIEALESVNLAQPDLILMDLSMPKMDGLTAARKIKGLPETNGLPMICLTAHGEAYRQSALDAGFCELLIKPFDIDSLIGVIEKSFHL